MHAPRDDGEFELHAGLGRWFHAGRRDPPDHVQLGSGGTQLVGTIAGQHTYAAAGDYCVVATVTDPDGGSNSQTLAVTVNAPVPPPPG